MSGSGQKNHNSSQCFFRFFYGNTSAPISQKQRRDSLIFGARLPVGAFAGNREGNEKAGVNNIVREPHGF